jgi:hypothetical protein
MRDLNVANTHTYYVVAWDTPILVHNCGDLPEGYTPSPVLRGGQTHTTQTRRLRATTQFGGAGLKT